MAEMYAHIQAWTETAKKMGFSVKEARQYA